MLVIAHKSIPRCSLLKVNLHINGAHTGHIGTANMVMITQKTALCTSQHQLKNPGLYELLDASSNIYALATISLEALVNMVNMVMLYGVPWLFHWLKHIYVANIIIHITYTPR